MFSKTLVVLAMAAAATAYQTGYDAYGCTGVGTACTWSDAQGNTVNGFCAPDGFCGDNGATCTTSDECYNWCGTDGICGGAGAHCNAQDSQDVDLQNATCFTPGFTCSIGDGAVEADNFTPAGTCSLAASQAARMKLRNRAAMAAARSERMEHEALRRAVQAAVGPQAKLVD